MKFVNALFNMVILLTCVGCTQNKTTILPLKLPQSEFIIKSSNNHVLEDITKKFTECATGTYSITSFNNGNYLALHSSTSGLISFYVEKISENENKIYVSPAFDSMHKKEAELFKMGVLEEEGCPR